MFDVWYWTVLERNEDGRYFAFVPDLPGTTAAGSSEKEVLQNIAEIAAEYVRDLVEDGHEVPKARSTEEIERQPEGHEYGRAAIPVDVPGRSVKISLSIDEALLKRVDRAANGLGMTRSGFFADCAHQRLGKQPTNLTDSLNSEFVRASNSEGAFFFSGPGFVKEVAGQILRQGSVLTQKSAKSEKAPQVVRQAASGAFVTKHAKAKGGGGIHRGAERRK